MTKLYPTIRNSIFTDHFDTFDFLTNFDAIFGPTRNDGPRGHADKSRHIPPANIIKTETGYSIELAAPGFSREDFEMTIENDILSVCVHTEDTKEYTDAIQVREWNFESFKRSWTLPKNTNIETINARYEAGILHVDVPVEGQRDKRRTITIE